MLTSIYKQSKTNGRWQIAIEISHFLCLHAWPLQSRSGEGFEIEIHNLKTILKKKKHKIQKLMIDDALSEDNGLPVTIWRLAVLRLLLWQLTA